MRSTEVIVVGEQTWPLKLQFSVNVTVRLFATAHHIPLLIFA